VNTFCALIWTLFGEECDYYKGLLEVAETLDQQEVHIIRDSFTPNVCRRITWAILMDGRSFFNTVLVAAQFRSGERFRWPTSLIHKITDNVRFATAIERPMYPVEWLIPSSTVPSMPGGGGGRGSSGGGGGGGTGGRGASGGTGQDGQLAVTGGGGRRQQQQRQQWVDSRHPRIITMMADYVAAKGLRIKLTEILDAANKRITDLPTIPAYVENGRPFVCWAHILGRCTFANCQFKLGHVPRSKIPDSFADAVVAMLTPGVRHCVNGGKIAGGLPEKWQKTEGQT
jgi:hypothetical protein